MSNESSEERHITCPWCNENQVIEKIEKNMILAFNCVECDEPIILIQDIAMKIDKDVLESGDIEKLQDYVLHVLETEFGIPASDTEIDITEVPSFDSETPISRRDISNMKNFLDNYKIPRDGHMFE